MVRAMPTMLKALAQHPELGCLGTLQYFGRTTLMVQYWRDFESLDRFARDRDLPHLEPWRRFNRAARSSDAVGVWHETYRVAAGQYEAICTRTCPRSDWPRPDSTCRSRSRATSRRSDWVSRRPTSQPSSSTE